MRRKHEEGVSELEKGIGVWSFLTYTGSGYITVSLNLNPILIAC